MRVRSFEDVQAQLDKVNWSNLEQPANVLSDIGPDKLYALYEPLLAQAVQDTDVVHLKPTHAKIHLAGASPGADRAGPMLWAHDYRFGCALDPGQIIIDGQPYIETFHNHRHSFVSIQAGEKGFTEDRVSPADQINARLKESGFWIPGTNEWQPITRNYKPGDILKINGPYDIHRVYNAGSAITFLAQGPNQNGRSLLFNESGQIIGERADLRTHLAEKLRSVSI